VIHQELHVQCASVQPPLKRREHHLQQQIPLDLLVCRCQLRMLLDRELGDVARDEAQINLVAASLVTVKPST
jgi:hypothetical protein